MIRFFFSPPFVLLILQEVDSELYQEQGKKIQELDTKKNWLKIGQNLECEDRKWSQSRQRIELRQ